MDTPQDREARPSADTRRTLRSSHARAAWRSAAGTGLIFLICGAGAALDEMGLIDRKVVPDPGLLLLPFVCVGLPLGVALTAVFTVLAWTDRQTTAVEEPRPEAAPRHAGKRLVYVPNSALFGILLFASSWMFAGYRLATRGGGTEHTAWVAVSLAATAYLVTVGRRAMRPYWPPRPDERIAVTGWQIVWVVLFAIAVGVFTAKIH